MAKRKRDDKGRYASKGLSKPKTSPVLADMSEGFSAVVKVAADTLINPDIAYRTNRTLQEQMIRDPMIMAPLQKRMLATAQLEWEVVPEDDNDAAQKKVALEVQKVIEGIPNFIDVLKDLLWGVWRGTGVSEMGWDWDQGSQAYKITGHRPHNGDKIAYDTDGNPRILTTENQSAGRILTQSEQERLIIHTFDPEDGAFFDGAEAAYLFKGRGLRDLVWQYWWLKHNALFFWLNYIERFGGGFVLGKYPMNNKAAKTAIESVLKNMTSDSRVSVPVPPTVTPGAEEYGIEVVSAGGEGKASSELFHNFVEKWAGKHIRMLILGQEFGYEDDGGGGGIGSNRADRLQDTFRAYRDYDAVTLAQTITDSLVARIVRFNFGDVPFKLKFQFILEKDDYEQAEKKVKAAKELQLPISKEWAYRTLGIPQPKEDDEVIDFAAEALEAEERSAKIQAENAPPPVAGAPGRFAGMFQDVRPSKRAAKYDMGGFVIGQNIIVKGRIWEIVGTKDGSLVVEDENGLRGAYEPHEVQKLAETARREKFHEQSATQVTPLAVDVEPHVHVQVTMPEAAPPTVTVEVPTPSVVVEAPNVVVENKVETTRVVVENQIDVQPSPAPDVTVDVKAPIVNVETPKADKKIVIKRDANGNIVGGDIEEK